MKKYLGYGVLSAFLLAGAVGNINAHETTPSATAPEVNTVSSETRQIFDALRTLNREKSHQPYSVDVLGRIGNMGLEVKGLKDEAFQILIENTNSIFMKTEAVSFLGVYGEEKKLATPAMAALHILMKNKPDMDLMEKIVKNASYIADANPEMALEAFEIFNAPLDRSVDGSVVVSYEVGTVIAYQAGYLGAIRKELMEPALEVLNKVMKKAPEGSPAHKAAKTASYEILQIHGPGLQSAPQLTPG